MIKSIILILNIIFNLCLMKCVVSGHDIKTLKSLQIVHRHGDRTPRGYPPNDPFQNLSLYWPESSAYGLNGQLTNRGKYRLYKLGEFIRNEYDSFLGNIHSPREVYVRSSLVHRCIESVALLLSGAYPPRDKLQWHRAFPDGETMDNVDLGSLWQPIPIETFMPKHDDYLLVGKKYPHVHNETEKIYNSEDLKKLFHEKREFLHNISTIVGTKLDNLLEIKLLLDTLDIEVSYGYYWGDKHKNWSKKEEEESIKILKEFHNFHYHRFNKNSIITKAKAGNLIKEIVDNVQHTIGGARHEKLYIYSTHDTMVAPLLGALQIFNYVQPPFGAAVIFELHELHPNDYYIRIYYLNETFTKILHPMKMECYESSGDGCPLQKFFDYTKNLIIHDIDEECGGKDHNKYLAHKFN